MQTTDADHHQLRAPGASSQSAVSADKLPEIRHIIAVGSRPCKTPETRMNASFPGCSPMAESLGMHSNLG